MCKVGASTDYPDDAESLSPSATVTGVLVLTGSEGCDEEGTSDTQKTYRNKVGLVLHVLLDVLGGRTEGVYPISQWLHLRCSAGSLK